MTDPAAPNPVNILLVEDNPGDVRLTQEVFKETHLLNRLDVVNDGEAALRYLRREAPYTDMALPDLILLDLNLPKINGLEVLAAIKADDRLKRIPVVVLTTSDAEQDIARSYERYASCYITKPVDLDQFVAVIQGIDEFWLQIVRLPPN